MGVSEDLKNWATDHIERFKISEQAQTGMQKEAAPLFPTPIAKATPINGAS